MPPNTSKPPGNHAREFPGAALPWLGRRDLLPIVSLFAAALLAYLPALEGGRLLDDDLHITRPELQSLHGLGRIWFQIGATQQYYPVLHTAFWLEHRLWGDAVAGYHVVNVLLHASAACLIVPLMRRLRLPGAWLAAFLFALHPVCVETVAWIAEQKNTLSTVLALAAAIAYLQFDQNRRRSAYLWALGLFLLALLSKTAVVTLPAILLVVVWWERAGLRWRRDVRPMLPWFVVCGAVGLITLSVERRLLIGVGGNFALTLPERVLLVGRAFWFYLGKLVWPSGLTFFYPRWEVSAAAGWQYLYPLAGAALWAALWFAARWRRGPLAVFLCFAGALAPVLGFFNVEWFVFSYVADHLQYFASLAVLIPLAAVVASSVNPLPESARRVAPAAAGLCALTLGALTWRQCERYGDPVTFYRTAAALNPSSAAAHANLGTVLAALPGRMPEALDQFGMALRINPNAADGHEMLGTVLLQDPARRAESAAELEIAARLRPDRKSVHDKLALALSGLPDRRPEAIAEYQASLRIDPLDPAIHNSLGLAYARMSGQLNDAIVQYEAALRLDPHFAEAHNNLGLALAQTGRLQDAIAHFEEAVRLKPDFAGGHNNLGLGWTLIPGRMNDAIGEFKEALRLDPHFAPGWHMLGMAYVRSGNPQAAAAAFRQELQLTPDNPAAQQALAAAVQQAQGR